MPLFRAARPGKNQVSLKLDDLSDGAATVPFFVTLRFGEERIIAQNGALELRARCILASGITGDSLELVVSSTLDGWLATSAGRSTTTANLAGDDVVLFTAVGQPGQGRLSGFGDERFTGAQLALAPDGSFLALPPGSTALGVDLFDQDCLAVGTVSLIRGVLPAAPEVGQPLEGFPDTSGAVATGNRDRRRRGQRRHLGRSHDRQSHLGLAGYWRVAHRRWDCVAHRWWDCVAHRRWDCATPRRWDCATPGRWDCAIPRRRHFVHRRPHAAVRREHSPTRRRYFVHRRVTGRRFVRAERPEPGHAAKPRFSRAWQQRGICRQAGGGGDAEPRTDPAERQGPYPDRTRHCRPGGRAGAAPSGSHRGNDTAGHEGGNHGACPPHPPLSTDPAAAGACASLRDDGPLV